jgi:hypothetical protein
MTEQSHEAFRAQLPGIPPVDGEKMSRPERQNYSHAAEKAPPFVLTQEDNRVLIEVQAKHRVQIEIKYGLEGVFFLGHEKYCRDNEGRVTKC